MQEKDFTGQLEIYGGACTIIFWFRNGTVKDAVYYKDDSEVLIGGGE